jgi:FkbM family methyltransferase
MSLLDVSPGSLAGKLLRLPLKMVPRGAVVPVLTGVNRGCRWRVGSSIHGCWLGTYESDKQRLMGRLAAQGMTAWDIGANAGFYTLALSRSVGPAGRVHAFEPLPENAANVLDHIRLNGCDNAALHRLALSDRDGEATFRTNVSNAMGCLAVDGELRVQTRAMDTLIGSGELPVPDIVKMDVEGAESLVLEGALKLLSARKTIWVIALHDEVQRLKVGSTLGEHNYRLFRLDGSEIFGDIDTDEIYALPGDGDRA